jgi:hypothetical protein
MRAKRRRGIARAQLVPFLLNSLIETTKHTGPLSDPPLPAPEPLKTDGICGPKTIAAILWLQKSRNSGGHAYLAEDATVNHVEVIHYGPSPGGKLYILWEIQMLLEGRNALPRSAADTELSKWFDKGLTLKT